jgi:threonine aldolase
MIDLRSDTVTKPTEKMRLAMLNAEVGDDVYGEDETMNYLENIVAGFFGKEAALFFPSGTMSNLTAVLTWCEYRSSEIILGDKSHMFLFEQANASQYGGVSYRTIENLDNGTMDITKIKESIRENDIHESITKLICIENTHNVCGGRVLPISFMEELKKLSEEHLIPIHMDGARIWNALTMLDIKPYDIGKYVDSISVCLSKGLGAPVGSLLIGSSKFIEKAKRIRKSLGGGMRQTGNLAAAGLVSINDYIDGILGIDHNHTKILVNEISKLTAFKIKNEVDTNIIFINIITYDKTWDPKLVGINTKNMFKERGVLLSVWEPTLLRIVVHRDITYENINSTVNAFKEINNCFLNKN